MPNVSYIKQQVTDAFKRLFQIPNNLASSLPPQGQNVWGKLYEAKVLSLICEELVQQEQCSLTLISGACVTLKFGGGPINRSFPYVRVCRQDGSLLGEIFTDVFFVGQSHALSCSGHAPTAGHYHELDVVLVKAGVVGMPVPSEILLATECKATTYKKSFLRESLGVRRELSMMSMNNATGFTTWPSATVPCIPSSCLLVYSTSVAVLNYSGPGGVYGIQLHHVAM